MQGDDGLLVLFESTGLVSSTLSSNTDPYELSVIDICELVPLCLGSVYVSTSPLAAIQPLEVRSIMNMSGWVNILSMSAWKWSMILTAS